MITAKTLLVVFSMIFVILSGCIEIESTVPDSSKSVKNATKDTIPPSSISYLQSTRSSNWINWEWENPEDKDFSHVMIFIDGRFKVNVAKTKNYYNLTGLRPERQYRIGIVTVDSNKNINYSWVNDSTSTLPIFKDKIPPDKIWYLEAKIGNTWINWTWENPEDSDFRYTNIYIDGNFKINLTKPKNYYNLTNLRPETSHMISIRTVDANKNVNPIWVSSSATTLP